jgi:hypothetical protein
MHGVIKVEDTDEAARMLAGFTREGICFDCERVSGLWIITLTGGF